MPGNQLLIKEVQGEQLGYRAYDLNTGSQTLESLFATTEDHGGFENRATCSLSAGASWGTSAFIQYDAIDFNYLLTNDGAVIATGAAQAEASSGIACRVDGHCGYGYDGNVCQGGGRHYSHNAVDAFHTVWLYVRDGATDGCASATSPPTSDAIPLPISWSLCSNIMTVRLWRSSPMRTCPPPATSSPSA